MFVIGTAVVVIAAVVAARRHEQALEAGVRFHPYPAGALAEELAGCHDLGPLAAENFWCRAAWARNRDRFLGPLPDAMHGTSSDDTGEPKKDQDRPTPPMTTEAGEP